MHRVNARAALGDHVLHGRVHFEDFVHAEHVEEQPAFERRADAHADAALGHDGDFVLVGEP